MQNTTTTGEWFKKKSPLYIYMNRAGGSRSIRGLQADSLQLTSCSDGQEQEMVTDYMFLFTASIYM